MHRFRIWLIKKAIGKHSVVANYSEGIGQFKTDHDFIMHNSNIKFSGAIGGNMYFSGASKVIIPDPAQIINFPTE